MNLSDPITKLPFVGEITAQKLGKLGISSIQDLLMHIPRRYLDFRNVTDFNQITIGENVTVQGKVVSIKNAYTRTNKKIQTLTITNGEKELIAVWFNQPYLVKNFTDGEEVSLSGSFNWFGKRLAMLSPEYEKKGDLPLIHTGRLVPVYPETAGITSKWLRRKIAEVLEQGLVPTEYLDENHLSEFEILAIEEALMAAHLPVDLDHAELGRKRLAFDELLSLQIQSLLRKVDWEIKKPTIKLTVNNKKITEFIKSMPFELTNAQKTTIDEILIDISKDTPMNRLVQGDVGSGKTVIAAIASYAAYINGYQSVFMAPTQILAQQHYQTLSKLFEESQARVSLITSSSNITTDGRPDIIVGTHALNYDRLDLSQAAIVVIDEQHRFGVKDRAKITGIAGGELVPHILTMTATPIPRTIALTLYGDLSLSVVNELPQGRKPITTWVVPNEKRIKGYKWIEETVKKEKIQAFVVCPLIEESDAETMQEVKAAKHEYEELKKLLPNLKFGLLHGRMKGNEKDKVLEDFRAGKIDILIATPVVEVGIDVPNATIMVIEGADRFGLAQLHQLRGRVGRGEKQSYCLLFTDSTTEKTINRLEALTKTHSGFDLAELDLSLRGPGEIFGVRQSGFPELKRASWTDIDLIKLTKSFAEEIFKHPKKHKQIIDHFREKPISKN